MAQLKDTIVSGNLRVTDTTLTDTLQVTIINAPTSSGGTVYGPGTNGQILKSNGTTTYWAADSNTDTKVTSTLLAQSTAAATYLPTFVSAAGNSGVNIMNSFSFRHTVGTTSAIGNSRIVLGNATASGTANNEEGQIILYSSSTSYHTIKGSATASAVTHSLPTTGGTILNTGTTSFTQTLASGTKIGSIKINGTSTDIYAPTVNDAALTLKGAGTTVTTFTANSSSAKSLDIVAGSNVTVTADATNAKISIASSHPTITKSTDTTSTASPTHGGTFTTVDSVTRDGNGHVTKINTKTVTLPADSNTDTKVRQSQTTTTNYRPILFGAKNSTDVSTLADTITDEAYTSTKLYAQPSAGLIYCTGRKIENVTIQTGSTKAAHITLQTLMTWLITTKTYIPSGQYCHVIISTTWAYANNDILQANIDGVNYEIQLAGVIIEFIGSATSYNAGVFRLLIHSSPTINFTATSGYSKFPVSTIAEYTCNGSDYLPTWKKIWNSHPTYTSKSSGLYKITVDGTGHVSAATAVAKADITALGIPGSDTNTTYTLGTSGNNVTLTPSSGSVQSITVPYASNAAASNSLKITGYGISNLTFYQANDDFGGTEGRKGNNDDNYWSHYIIANHGNGETYYHYTLRLPFWGSPQYQRKTGGSDATTSRTKWLDFITEENYTTYTVTKTGGGASGTWGISITGNASTSTKTTQDGDGNTISSTYLKLSGGTMTGTIQGKYYNTHIALAAGGIGDYADLDHKNDINISSWYGVSISNGCSNAGTLDQVTFSVNARSGLTQQRGNAVLYSASGDSPALIFQRGTFVDDLNDWKIYVSGGALYFAQSTENASSETWTNKMYFHASDGNLYVGSTRVSLNGHTHNYAGSSSAGGAATSANKLNTDAGTTSIPVYFSGGVPVQCTTPNAYQTNTTTNADYRVLFSTNANDTTQSGTTRKNINLQYNPSTATLKIGEYVSGSTATKTGKLVLGNSLNVYTHTINTNTDKLSNVSLTLNSTDGIMGTDTLCYKGYEGANLASDTAPGTLADISSLSNSVSFSGYLSRFSYFTVLLCIGTDVTARTTVQVSAIAGYQSYQLIWGGAPNHSGGNLSITSGLVNISESSGTITLNFGKCASYWQFSSASSTPTKGTTPDIHVLKVYGHSIRSNGYH